MSFDEEPESQIDPTHAQSVEDHDLPPIFGNVAYAPGQSRRSISAIINDPGSDETIPDANTDAMSSPISQCKVMDSQITVKDTQFIGIEQDTQPSMGYDMSPISRRALDNIESVSTRLPPPMATFQPLERRDTPVDPGNSKFRFGRPPNPSGPKFTRPSSRQNSLGENNMTDSDSMMTTSDVLPSSSRARTPLINILSNRGGTATTSLGKRVDSDLPSTQSNSNCPPNHEPRESSGENESSLLENLNHITESCLDISLIPEEVLIIMTSEPGVEFIDPSKIKMHTQLAAAFKPSMIANKPPRGPSHTKRPTKSGSPPFVEEILQSNMKHKSPRTANYLTRAERSSPKPNYPVVSGKPDEQNRNLSCPDLCSSSESNLINNLPKELPMKSSGIESGSTASRLSNELKLAIFHHNELTQSESSKRQFSEPGHVLNVVPGNSRLASQNVQPDGSTVRHEARKLKSGRPNCRPLPDVLLEPQKIPENHDIRDTAGTEAFKGDLVKSKTAHRTRAVDLLVKGSEPPDSAAMLQMAAILATAEKEQREQGIAKTQLQELQIKDLRTENAGLNQRIENLSTENQELLSKVDDFRRRNEKCRTKMNEVTRAHKELYPAAKALDKRRFEVLAESAKEMDAELLKKKALLSREWKALFSEARVKLDSQDKMIEVLSRDLENQLLDLQRERGLRESLQRQLENREKQEQELKSLLFSHQQDTIEALSGHEYMLTDLANTGATSLIKLNECRARIQSMEESEPKPITALIELNELIIALSKSIGEKFQEKEDLSIEVRNAGVEVLAELKNQLELVGGDYIAQKKLNVTSVGLHEENARLKERIQTQEREFMSLKNETSQVKQELQQCRAELTTRRDDLSNVVVAGREEAVLRTHLQDLQTKFSIAQDQVESATNETERVKGKLLEQENLAMLSQQENIGLRDRLQKSETMVSSFHAQKEAYIRHENGVFAKLRLQMEQDLQARLEEDKISYNDNISGLRRQFAEAIANLGHANKKVQDLEELSLKDEAETHHISSQLLAVMAELTTFKDEYKLMDRSRNQIESDLRTSQDQLSQCVKNISEWSSRNQNTALELAKRCDEIEGGLKNSEKAAETEIEYLRQALSTLQKKIENSKVVSDSIAQHLQDQGMLDADLTLAEWAKQLSEGHCLQKDASVDCPHDLESDEIRHVIESVCESPFRDFQGEVRAPTVLGANTGITERITDMACAKLAVQDDSHELNQSLQILDETRSVNTLESRRPLPSPLLTALNECGGQGVSKNKNDLNPRSVSRIGGLKFSENINNPSSGREAIFTPRLESSTCLDHSKVHPGSKKRLEMVIGPVIADSQEEFAQQDQNLPSRVGERRRSTPHFREAKRTVTTTEHTEYSVRRSETYRDVLMLHGGIKNGVRLGDQSFDSECKEPDEYRESDHESSGLSDPPDNMENFDFTEYLDDFGDQSRNNEKLLRVSYKEADADGMISHLAPSPRPNSSRVRTEVDAKGMKPPKSILKRSSIETRNDACNSASLSSKPASQAQPSKLQKTSGYGASKRPRLRTNGGTSGIESARFGSSYNRVVSGNRTSHNSNYFQVPAITAGRERASAADSFPVASSPVIGQPQRNSKKRTISGVDFSNTKGPAKVQRLDSH